MTLVTTSPETYAAVWLLNAELGSSTSPVARSSVVAERTVDRPHRTYVGSPSWSFLSKGGSGVAAPQTSVEAPLVVGADRLEDPVVAQIQAFRSLKTGWDGEGAAEPSAAAIREAVKFIRLVGAPAAEIEPYLHVDGSVLVELPNDAGSLGFRGDRNIIFVFDEIDHGTVPFDGFTIPEKIRSALLP